jgi:hypothetical protein
MVLIAFSRQGPPLSHLCAGLDLNTMVLFPNKIPHIKFKNSCVLMSCAGRFGFSNALLQAISALVRLQRLLQLKGEPILLFSYTFDCYSKWMESIINKQ